ncbi:hypothetical protein NEICINOT_04132 [Neisseria cinerea ATCC 14685]|uniref:Uncharacterized protein n=1 Tax=Neisseria cinerea ATCC 14685 TaxID=546262 RepID=D0W394_NEICI|nr:hypothetical protein NEICINOT_04132 [Neisseria cinerea ATCC 14685]
MRIRLTFRTPLCGTRNYIAIYLFRQNFVFQVILMPSERCAVMALLI